MSELSSLEARLDAAISQIREAFESRSTPDKANGVDSKELEKLAQENATLTSTLSALQDQRQRDIADLDTLIEQLKPLVEGSD